MATQNIPLYIPTYIGSPTYQPARVLPRIFFYNGLVDCQAYFLQGFQFGVTNAIAPTEFTAFPYFDNYNVITGSFPTTDSKSLLFNNEGAAYGFEPTENLYTEYWSRYIDLLYNPHTRLLNCSAIIPLADYFNMELNDIVQWRGNYYHLRAINNYSLKNGTCDLQLLGPILNDIISAINPELSCDFDYDLKSNLLEVDYLVVGGGGAGGGFTGAGGGGGQYNPSSNVLLTRNTTYPVIVGAGGLQEGGDGFKGSNGQSSSFNGVISIGGGAGGAFSSDNQSLRDGSSGSSGGGGSTNGNGVGGIGTAGNNGGNGINGVGSADYSGGGGGASAVGASGSLTSNGGNGTAWIDGNYYAGGGGGFRYETSLSSNGSGGLGGGGNGGQTQPITGMLRLSTSGSANTGGGGGGAIFGDGNWNGGSGVVKIRYTGSVSQATGGTISYSGSYTYHTFTSSGNFTLLL